MPISVRLPTFTTDAALDGIEHVERWLWVAVIGLYGVGDILTSIVLMELGVHESVLWLNELIQQYGNVTLLAHKLAIFAVIAVALGGLTVAAHRLDLPAAPFRSAILLMFAARGALLVAWNCYIIYVVVTHDVPPATPVPF